MKKFTAVEERIYLAIVRFDNKKQSAYNVHASFVKKFPEYEGSKYDFDYKFGQLSILRIYFESCFDFVED